MGEQLGSLEVGTTTQHGGSLSGSVCRLNEEMANVYYSRCKARSVRTVVPEPISDALADRRQVGEVPFAGGIG